MARRIYGYDGDRSRSPLYGDVQRGTGGIAGGKFITNDGTAPVPVHGWLVRLDGVLILRLGDLEVINTLP